MRLGRYKRNLTPTVTVMTWLGSDRWSMEFSVGKEAETESVMLHIRGGEKPKEVFAVLSAGLDTRFIDCSTDEFWREEETTSFERWKAYCDKIVNDR